jgi:Tat protein secretion system quality control protein TatD with DNase activity
VLWCSQQLLPLTVAALAEIKGMPQEAIALETTQNAYRLFGIKAE